MTDVKNAKDACRGRGRPQIRPDEETLALVVDAARAEFLANGFAGASTSAVAQRAGVSTKTLYRLIPTKEELFKCVVAQRIGRFMIEIDEKSLAELDLEQALERILAAYGALTLDGETTGMVRLVLAEGERFPEIGKGFYEAAIQRTTTAMAAWLERQRLKGLLDLDDPHRAAGMLRGMMIMEPQRAVMFGVRAPPGREEIVERARACAAIFLRGCQRRA